MFARLICLLSSLLISKITTCLLLSPKIPYQTSYNSQVFSFHIFSQLKSITKKLDFHQHHHVPKNSKVHLKKAMPGPKSPVASKPPPRPRKVYDILLDPWYFNEINYRHNKDAGLFWNYQINPYTKKTLQYVTPKPNERRPPLPDPCKECLTEDEEKLLESHRLVKRAMDRSRMVPKCKFCGPETELMRLGWFPDPPPPVPARTCMFILPPWLDKPSCYYYPSADAQPVNENYDERFRATHTTAEFIKHDTMLKKFDSIMNPNGYRGQTRTPRILPGTRSAKQQQQ